MPQPAKAAIVTGAGTGIGLATVDLLVENGVRVVVVGRSREPLQAVLAALSICLKTV